jgi:hypothetical protein
MINQRVSAFLQIRKGFRIQLYDISTTVQQTDFAQLEEAAITFGKIAQLLAMWTHHARLEDRLLLPLIQEYDSAIAKDLKQKLGDTAPLINRLLHQMTANQSVSDETLRWEMGSLVSALFHEWMGFVLLYFHEQETALGELLRSHDHQKETLNQPRHLHQIMLPEQFMEQSKWILRAINNPEVISWLQAVKNEAPELVFQSLLYLAEQELPPQRWTKVQEALCEGALLA